MLTLVKPVYYCEFCKRHRLTKQSIEAHEPRCIYNPARSLCGWHKDEEPDVPGEIALQFKDDPNVSWLDKRVGGCPACMLAVIVQARRLGLHDEEAWDFDYKAQAEKWRESERYDDVW